MEPENLKRGKKFHKIVQLDWERSIKDGDLNIEHAIDLSHSNLRLKHSRKGRMDMFVDELGDFVSVIEIKSTDWEKIKQNNLRRLLSSHERQIWKYISRYVDIDRTDVCPGIIYPKEPKSKYLRNHIENYLSDYGIQVVWYYD